MSTSTPRMIIVIFSLAAIYFICSMIGILPAGW